MSRLAHCWDFWERARERGNPLLEEGGNGSKKLGSLSVFAARTFHVSTSKQQGTMPFPSITLMGCQNIKNLSLKTGDLTLKYVEKSSPGLTGGEVQLRTSAV